MGRNTDQATTRPGAQAQPPSMQAHARAYARRGWWIVPLWWVRQTELVDPNTGELLRPGGCACPQGLACSSPGKHPHTKHGTKEPLKTGLDVDVYWARHPHCNIGIATGAGSDIVVLDIDSDKGGVNSMRQLWQRYGPPGDTPISVTGGGGRHVLFQHPGSKVKNVIGYMPGIDVRGDGGLIVAPPSLHVTGNRYHWQPQSHPKNYDPEPMPTWMMVFLEASEARRRAQNRSRYNGKRVGGRSKYGRALDPDSLPAIAEGERNNTLCSIAGRLIWENREEDEVLQMVHGINREHCKPPLPEREVDTLVKHAYRRWATST